MKLSDAPAIIGRHYPKNGNYLIQAARRVRTEFAAAPNDGGDLRQIAPDIWAIDKPLGFHTDKTARGHYVFGCVITNDAGLLLCVDNVLYDAPPGTIYSLDGHRRHGVLAHNGVKPGLLSFLAWDVLRSTHVHELVSDLPSSLLAWAKGEERIDVS